MNKQLYILTLFALLIATGCERSFDELNTDPKHPVAVPANTLFLAGEKKLADVYTSSIWTSSPFRVLAQVWTQTANINEARYVFTANNAPGGWWTRLYTEVLGNLEEAKKLYADEALPDAVVQNKRLITDILQVYAYYLLVNTYGDVPYQEALSRTIPFPAYDDAQTITYDLLTRLDTDIAGLDIHAASFGDADQLYQGEVALWKKFAATLKLKVALLLADVDPEIARTKALEAVQTGIIDSEEASAKFQYIAGTVANANPIWQDLVNGTYATYYAPAAFFVEQLAAWNDPRLPLWFTKDVHGGYSGAIAGQGGVNSELSKFTSKWTDAAAPTVLLDYAEAEFLLAEAVERGIPVTGNAALHYQQAIHASILSVGGTDAQANTYIQQAEVNYSSAAGNWRQKIGYQKWIAFANRNWDAWTEIRRLGYPNLDVVSRPVNAISDLPKRFYYPPAEQNSNAAHWREAVSKLPGAEDGVAAKLFWMK